MRQTSSGARALRNLANIDRYPGVKVVVCDDAGSADAVAEAWGELATTWPGRRNTWHTADWSVLAGRDVVMLASATDASRKRARGIAGVLTGLGCMVRIGLPDGTDGSTPQWWIRDKGKAKAREYIGSLLGPASRGASKTQGPIRPSAAPLPDVSADWPDTNPHYRLLGIDEDGIVIRLSGGTVIRRQRDRMTSTGVLIALAPQAFWCAKMGEEKITASAARTLGDVVIRAADKRGTFELDDDPHLAGLPDGRIVDLRTGEVRAADQDGDRYVVSELGAVPGDGEPALWLRTLGELFVGHEEGIAFMQRWMGYCLTGHAREHKFLVMHGPGGTGKSTLLSIMQRVSGTYYAGINQRGLFGAHGDHLEYLMRLKGKRLATVDDAPSHGWRASEINGLVSGESLTARGMGAGSEDFISTSKLVFTANALPEISPPSPGIDRRIMPLELPASLEADIARRDDLIAEVPQIVSWAIQGAREWYREGLAPTSIIESAVLDFARISDQIGAWIDECCELDDTFTVTMRELQGSYLEWSDGRRLTARQFRTYTSHVHGNTIAPLSHHGKARGYRGLRVRLTSQQSMM